MTVLEARRPAVARRTPAAGPAMLTILLAAQLMAILDVNIANVAGATIRSDLHTSGAELQVVIAGYTVTYAVLLITGARVGGALGYSRAFLLGLGTFTAASLACALAQTTWQLIAFRLLQGAGAAFMIPQVFSLIQRNFDGPARARALGRYAAVISGGVVLGQILGGVLVDADLFGAGWRPVFMINVPVGLALLLLGRRLLPVDRPEPGRPLDLAGLVTLGAAVLTLVTPLVFGHELGWPAWCWVSLAASAVLFGGFVTVQRRAAAPLMPGRLFRAAGLVPALGALFAMMFSYGGYLFVVALHLQAGLGFSALKAGLMFAPMAVCFGIASLNWRRIPERWHRRMIPVGLVLASGSVAAIALLLSSSTPGFVFLLAGLPFGIGSGLAFSPLMARGLAGVRPEDASDGSGLVTTLVQLAQVLGLAVLGSIYLTLAPSHLGRAIGLSLAVAAAAALVAAAVALALPRPAAVGAAPRS